MTQARFIPAHAGNRTRGEYRKLVALVHPRACGEQTLNPERTCHECGSSPRMRGTVAAALFGVMCGRFIPAHAGNSLAMADMARNEAVHPRACGEQAM